MLPETKNIAQLSDTQIGAVLDALFEPCAALKSYLIPKIRTRPSANYPKLIDFCRACLHTLIDEYETDSQAHSQVCNIVCAHPRLGVPKRDISSLSVHSQNEQKSLNCGDPNGELGQKLARMNELYEEKFPGLIFVVFVNGRTREEIIEIMKERIASSNWKDEVRHAFDGMCDIALDRVNKLEAKL